MSATITKKPAKQAASTNVRSITLPAKCKPSRCVGRDIRRPTLMHAYLRRRRGDLWLLATDSYIALGVKVDGDAHEGWVPIGALRAIEAGRDVTQLGATAWTVSTTEGSITYDVGPYLKDFPDLEGVGLWERPATSSLDGPFGLNADFVKRLSDGLGAVHGLRFDVTGPLKPIYIAGLALSHDAVAIQMPIRVNA